MARIQYTLLAAGGATGGDLADIHLVKHTQKVAIFFDDVDKVGYRLTGKGFEYKNGHLVDGTVSRFEIENQFGEDFAILSGRKVHISKPGDDSYQHLFSAFVKGDDLVLGSAGNDILSGGDGNNRMKGFDGDDQLIGGVGNDYYIGGTGSDIFYVGYGFGKDVIEDFDADGGGNDQDYFGRYTDDEYRISQVGDDTVINFGRGNKVTLLGVDAGLITEADFL